MIFWSLLLTSMDAAILSVEVVRLRQLHMYAKYV
jgi:hypothetical protein